MTFISYAQNYEDVMLRRAFKDIKKGFYIDVGANDPVIDSVTKAFYDSGWHGINIEPVADWFNKLQEARPNDTNLKLACGARKGQNTIYDVVGTGLSTMDKSIADKHANDLDFEIKEEKIEVDSLTNICKQYANQDIHFLKIDVEGFELQALKGLDLKKIRPWVIVIEATLPNSQIEDYEKWESILINGQYHFVYFDGLNRYYVASEHSELDNSFNIPPNYFDFFRRVSEQWALDELKASEQKVYAKESEKSLIAKDLDIANKGLSEQNDAIDLLKDELKASEQKVYAKESEKSLIAKDLDIANKGLSEQNDAIDLLKDELKASEQKVYAKESEKSLIAKDLDIANKGLSEQNDAIDLLKDELKASEQKVYELNQSSHHWWLASERLTSELHNVYNSKSWIITLPLRKVSQFLNWLLKLPVLFFEKVYSVFKGLIKRLLMLLIKLFVSNNKIKLIANKFISRFPFLKQQLRKIALNNGLIPKMKHNAAPEPNVIEISPDINLNKNNSMKLKTLDFFSNEAINRVSVAIKKNNK